MGPFFVLAAVHVGRSLRPLVIPQTLGLLHSFVLSSFDSVVKTACKKARWYPTLLLSLERAIESLLASVITAHGAYAPIP